MGPTSPFLGDASSPLRRDAESLGQALFDSESFETWADLYRINTFSLFFMTAAFLGLLEKGSEDTPGWTSSVINITSISGLIKVAQEHVSVLAIATWWMAERFGSSLTIARKLPHRI